MIKNIIKDKRLTKSILISLFIILLLILYNYLIITKQIKVQCILYKLTGLYCPSCGITRMFLSLLKLDFYQAFRYNPLI